ncbi:transmembrane protein [Rhodotorula toruloides]|uniref:Transmembrane protein n=1 Tax=Rhodotorula toruloides TaxID=5286 RepID=A0A511K867_RHOTO|nr:transmembrane protein [Rhodotorula toruloides]
MGFLPRISTRQGIAALKGAIAYTLAFILIFLHPFSRLNPYPVTLSGAILITIAGQPGLSVGAFFFQAFFAALGVGLGGAAFAILAKLGHSQVAQGFVFAVFVYFAALLKAQSIRYFGASLLFIILAFSGIYTSILSDGKFVPAYLESYLESYCWGFAIVVMVNLLVLPHSSEKELREILVISLEHISTFSHLLAKTYSLDITDDERAVRDDLFVSIRADMGVLNQKLAHTSLEINYSRWSMTDYHLMVGKLRQMQLGLIAAYSSLVSMERFHPRALELVKEELTSSGADKWFSKLRRGADLSFSDIVSELAVGKVTYHSPAPGERSWNEFCDTHQDAGDVEAGRSDSGRQRAFSVARRDEMHERMAAMRERLRNEVAGSTPAISRRPSMSGLADSVVDPGFAAQAAAALSAAGQGQTRKLDKAATLRKCWDSFKASQLASIQKILEDGAPEDDELHLHRPGPSVFEQYADAPPRHRARPAPAASSTAVGSDTPTLTKRSTTKGTDGASGASSDDEKDTPPAGPAAVTSEQICGSAVMRTFAFLAGMGSVMDELASLYDYIVPKVDSPPRRKKLRAHIIERRRSKAAPSDRTSKMSLREALARLSGRDFVPVQKSFWTRVAEMERLFRSPDSIYACKTAAAVAVFAVFLLAPSLHTFFINYGLTGGIITIVVAVSPTLGQSLLTFFLQILGTGMGSLIGLLMLRIFLDVGGYRFNPYGLASFAFIFGLPLSAIIYVKPMYFAGALLAMNSAGTLIVTEWTYNEIPGQIRPGFDSPAYRAAKQLVAMCIALAIAAIFQIFILRQPARQSLRQKLAHVSWSLNAHSALFSYLTEAVMPLREDSTNMPPPNWDAVEVLQNELVQREIDTQGQLLALMPLMKFASVEPTFGSPFRAAEISHLIRSHQLVLDRLREARSAIGAEGFSPEIRRIFSDVLVPYRRQGKRISRALFYFVATSLSTKAPLPPDLPRMTLTSSNIQHDALVLSRRLTKTEGGQQILRSEAFLRYWHFMTSYSSIAYILEGMEAELVALFGSQEESPFVADTLPKTTF